MISFEFPSISCRFSSVFFRFLFFSFRFPSAFIAFPFICFPIPSIFLPFLCHFPSLPVISVYFRFIVLHFPFMSFHFQFPCASFLFISCHAFPLESLSSARPARGAPGRSGRMHETVKNKVTWHCWIIFFHFPLSIFFLSFILWIFLSFPFFPVISIQFPPISCRFFSFSFVSFYVPYIFLPFFFHFLSIVFQFLLFPSIFCPLPSFPFFFIFVSFPSISFHLLLFPSIPCIPFHFFSFRVISFHLFSFPLQSFSSAAGAWNSEKSNEMAFLNHFLSFSFYSLFFLSFFPCSFRFLSFLWFPFDVLPFHVVFSSVFFRFLFFSFRFPFICVPIPSISCHFPSFPLCLETLPHIRPGYARQKKRNLKRNFSTYVPPWIPILRLGEYKAIRCGYVLGLHGTSPAPLLHPSCTSPAPLLHLSRPLLHLSRTSPPAPLLTSPAPLLTSPAPLLHLSCAPPDPCCTSPHLSSTLPAPLLTPVVAPFASNFRNVYRCCSGGCTHRSYFSRFPKVLLRSDLYFQKVSTGHSWAMHFPRVRDGVVPNMHLWAKLLQTCKWNIFQKFFHVPPPKISVAKGVAMLKLGGTTLTHILSVPSRAWSAWGSSQQNSRNQLRNGWGDGKTQDPWDIVRGIDIIWYYIF